VDVTDLVQRLLRRWIATVLVVLLAVLAAGAAYSRAGSTYASTATVVIVPPVLGDTVTDQNPLLNLDNNLAQLATVLASSLGAATMDERAGLESGSGTGIDSGASYTISTVTGDNPSFAQLSPQLVIDVTASTPEGAVRTSTALVAASSARLDELQSQAGTPFLSRATLVTVVSPTPAEAAGSERLRAGGSVGLGVLVLGLLGVLLLDELLTRRSSRAARREP
jgi:hypothetical protein